MIRTKQLNRIFFALLATFSLLNAEENITHQSLVEFNEQYFSNIPNANTTRGIGYKPFQRAKYFWNKRLNPDGSYPNMYQVRKDYFEWLEKNSKNNQLSAALEWKAVGPFDTPTNTSNLGGIGRINDISFHPTNKDIIWVASSSGGLYSTTDGGLNWKGYDQTVFASHGFTEVVISPSNSNIMYASTGDAHGPSGMGMYYSYGILRSGDAGVTWTLKPLPFTSNTAKIYRMIIHPSLPNTLYIATSNGVYLSTDGADSFTLISSNRPCWDILPVNGNVASMIGIFQNNSQFLFTKYSSGTTWATKATYNGCIRARISASRQDPNTIYAITVNSNNGYRSFERSVNGGESWTAMNPTNTFNILGLSVAQSTSYGQGSYDLAICVNPNNKDEVFVGGINIWKTTNGGTSAFQPVTDAYQTANGSIPQIHPDIHDLAYNQLDNKLYTGCDGGVFVSSDNGATWVDRNKGLNNTEYVRLSVATGNSNIAVAGAQDNGTTRKSSNNSWFFMTGGDGMDNSISPTDNSIIYSSSQNGAVFKNTNGGSSPGNIPIIHSASNGYGNSLPGYTAEQAYWCSPIAIDPTNANILYVGHRNVWKTTNGGNSFEKTSASNAIGNQSFQVLQALAVAPSNTQVLYASYSNFPSIQNDQSNTSILVKSTNGGSSWTQIFTNSQTIEQIAVDPKNANHLFVALSGFNASNKVFEITNSTAVNITGNLPNLPVNCIVYQPNSLDKIFIGTDVGVMTRDRNNTTWQVLGTGLPTVIVNDLDYNINSGKLIAATYGRGLWEVPVLDCDLPAPTVTITGAVLNTSDNSYEICPGNTLKLEVTNNLVNVQYEWSNGSKGKVINVTTAGDYFVRILDTKGCISISETFKVKLGAAANPTLTFDASKLNLCEGDSLEVRVNEFFRAYQWSNGAKSRRIFIKEPGTYSVICTPNNSSCTFASTSFTVNLLPSPSTPIITRDSNRLSIPSQEGVVIKWLLNGSPISGAEGVNLNLNTTGTYTVTATNSTSNCAKTSLPFVVNTILSVEDELDNSFELTPNPATQFVNVKADLKQYQNVKLRIDDMTGSTLQEIDLGNVNRFEYKLDLKNYAQGTYFVNLIIDNYLKYKRLVKID